MSHEDELSSLFLLHVDCLWLHPIYIVAVFHTIVLLVAIAKINFQFLGCAMSCILYIVNLLMNRVGHNIDLQYCTGFLTYVEYCSNFCNKHGKMHFLASPLTVQWGRPAT